VIAAAAAPPLLLGLAAAGLPVLAFLVFRERRGRPVPRPFPDPFLRADPLGLLSLFLAAFFGQVVLFSTLRFGAFAAAAVPLALVFGRFLWSRGLSHAFRRRGDAPRLAAEGLLVLWAALPAVYGIAWILEPVGAPRQETVDAIANRGPGWIPASLFAVLVAPVLEETAFRGALQPALRRLAGPRAALLATALLFGLVHYAPWTTIPPMAAFGLFLGLLVERTGSLVPCIAAHMGFNALTVSALLL
jgi:membrane protease YdiL (CAAX protease family)